MTITGLANSTSGTVVEFTNTPAAYDAEITDSTITANGGRAVDNSGIGGGVHVVSSTLTSNTGGGVDLVDGSPLVVETSTVSNNGGYGVKSTGQGTTVLTVSGSTISGNATTGVSCGACGTVTVTSSTVSDNGIGASAGGGGGIAVTTDQDDAGDAPVVSVVDTIVTGNNAEHDGGGLSVNWIEAHDATASVVTNVTGSTFTGNQADCAGCDGGGIAVNVGSLSVGATTLTANTTSGRGGGIHQDRRSGDELTAPTSFVLAASTLSGNTSVAEGGGASAHAATLTVDGSTIEGNTGGNGGGLSLGGIFLPTAVQSGDAAVTSSTVTANHATAGGGGIHMSFPDGSHSTITNSTIHANTAPLGGGLLAGLTEPVVLRASTVTANEAAVGANLAVSSFGSIAASIIAQPAGGGTNCAPVPGFALNLTSTGRSWYSDATCAPGATDTVAAAGDPQLGPLAPNGGPTMTRLPAPTSPVAGLIPAASCLVTTDQRGVARPAGIGCEPGSVEIVDASASIDGTANADVLVGTSAPDVMRGLAGGDLILGLGGADDLSGGPGNDILLGGPGNDHLAGGPGNDLLVGGGGADTFDGGDGFDLCIPSGRILPRVC